MGALALLFCEILLIASCFLLVTFLILDVDPSVFLLSDNGLLRIGLAGASILFGLYFENLYVNLYVKSRVLLIQQLSLVMGIALVVQGFFGYVNDGWRLPLRLMVPACAVLVVALFAWRMIFSAFVLRVVGAQRILLVGMCPVLLEMAAHIGSHPELGLQVVGYVDDGDQTVAPEAGRCLGPLSSLPRAAAQAAPDRLVVGFADRRGQMPIADLLQLRYGGMPIDEASAAYEQLCGRVLSGRVAARRGAPLRRIPAARAPHGSPDAGHWLLALILAILSAPLLLLACALLKLSSRRPLLSRQKCIGQGGRTFLLYSLRLPPADQRNGVERFVARWRLQTLPHLWNVLRGEMCFVGPRAERTEFANVLSEAIPFYRQRYAVKPGLTGWAQINTPRDQPEDTFRRLEYDLYYLKHFSRGLDAYILLHTVREVLMPG